MHDAHWYALWLGRWVSCDPSGLTDGTNRYGFARGSPLVLVDPSGLQGKPAQAAAAAPAAGWSVSVTVSDGPPPDPCYRWETGLGSGLRPTRRAEIRRSASRTCSSPSCGVRLGDACIAMRAEQETVGWTAKCGLYIRRMCRQSICLTRPLSGWQLTTCQQVGG